jgi:hypothetical protein
VANGTDDTVSVLLGDGAGGFGPATSFRAGNLPVSVVVGDFNRDGWLDLITANLSSDDVSVLLGDGSGGFGPAAAFRVGDTPVSMAAGDFNADGKLDLVTANADDDDVTVLLGNGAGGFAPAPGSPFRSLEGPRAVAVGDFNGDGLPDLAVANATSRDVSVLLNTQIAITINDVTVVEGDEGTSNMVFTVRLSRPSAVPLTLDFATLNGTAVAGVDFQNTFGSLTFAPGQTARSIVVPVFGDRQKEGDEKFIVQISNPSSGVILDGEGIGLILDDDDYDPRPRPRR